MRTASFVAALLVGVLTALPEWLTAEELATKKALTLGVARQVAAAAQKHAGDGTSEGARFHVAALILPSAAADTSGAPAGAAGPDSCDFSSVR